MATKRSVQQRRRSRRRAALVLVPTVGGVFIAGTAFAYWTTSGNGSGSSAAGNSSPVTVTQIGTVPANLTPGGTDQPISFRIDNPQSTNQYITSVNVAIASIIKGGTAASGCTNADFALTQPGGINQDITPSGKDFSGTGAAIRMINGNYNQDGCKGVTVNLSFTAA
jgi:hypothetical protein